MTSNYSPYTLSYHNMKVKANNNFVVYLIPVKITLPTHYEGFDVKKIIFLIGLDFCPCGMLYLDKKVWV